MPPDSGIGVALDAHQLVARAREQRLETLRLRLEGRRGPDADVDLLAVDDDRQGDVAPHSVAQHLDRRIAGRANGEHELVAAETCGQQVGPADLVDAPGDGRQHLVADGLAVQFVDRAELGDVDDHQPEPTALADQVVRGAHEPVTVEQPGAIVVVGEEVDAVASVGQRRGDLPGDDVAADRGVIAEVVDRELAGHEFAGGRDEARIEMHRLLRAQHRDGIEHLFAVVVVHEADERAPGGEFGIVTEQAGHRSVDRANLAVRVDERHHAVHVRHDRTHHGGLALVEFESVAVGRVAGDQHRDVAVAEPLHGPAHLECDPHAGPTANPHHDELAGVLLAHRQERGNGDVQVVRVDDVEDRSAHELLVGPAEHADRTLVGVAQRAVTVDGDHRIGKAVERRLGDAVRSTHEGVSARAGSAVNSVFTGLDENLRIQEVLVRSWPVRRFRMRHAHARHADIFADFDHRCGVGGRQGPP